MNKIKEKVLKEMKVLQNDSWANAMVDEITDIVLAEVRKEVEKEFKEWEGEDLVRTFKSNILNKIGDKDE